MRQRMTDTPRQFRILAVNPGSTSTKLGIYQDETAVIERNARHSDAELAPFAARPVLDQAEFRLDAIRGALADAHAEPHGFDAVVGRGGLLEPVPGGTYLIDGDVVTDLRAARRGEHASNLGPVLALDLARTYGCAAYLVDPVSVDEWPDIARYSGLAGMERESLSHALNSRAVVRRHARAAGTPGGAMRVVVVHMGSGITVSAHMDGRMVDACNSMDEGPFAMDRAGGVPISRLLDAVSSQRGEESVLRSSLFGRGGVYSYLGTRDLPAVLLRIDAGDSYAAEVIDAMIYQVCKEAGAMAAVLNGAVDAVLVTGGMVHSARIADALRQKLAWIAPVHTYAGEDELRALAEGALGVLRGSQPALRYGERKLPRPRLRRGPDAS
jgi:butyrate kinase